MTIEQILALARHALAGNTEMVTNIVYQMMAHERKARKHKNAERLNNILNTAKPKKMLLNHIKVDGIVDKVPEKTFSDMILEDKIWKQVMEMVHEHQEAGELLKHSLYPRHKILMVGPPGNGKTCLAEAIANHMKYRFLKVEYATLIGHFLGETAAHLKKIFEFATATPCVLFFDEFDTIGTERGAENEVGEIKRVVSSFLMHIDELPWNTIIICATNHPDILDLAAAGRFEIRLELGPPTATQHAEKFINMLAARHKFLIAAHKSSIRWEGKSYREIEQQVLAVMRSGILGKLRRVEKVTA